LKKDEFLLSLLLHEPACILSPGDLLNEVVKKPRARRTDTSDDVLRNKILAALPERELDLVYARLKPRRIELEEVMHEAGEKIEKVCFITSGLISVVTPMRDGSAVEIAVIGRTGMSGSSVLLSRLFLRLRASSLK
jgi:CRP-like cAMP-binding protein